MSLASDKAQPGPARVEFADPHAATSASSESEATRVRKLAGAWRWLLVVATAATIFLCINQQFTLRFFIGYTQLNTEYYYLLILCMLPFTFVIFPGSTRAPLDRAISRACCRSCTGCSTWSVPPPPTSARRMPSSCSWCAG